VYAVRLAGTLPDGALDHTPSSRLIGALQTILRGEVRDDAALHGLLRRLQTLNIAVLEVRRLPPRDPPAASDPGTATACPGIVGQIRVEAVLGGGVGDLAQSFLGEVLRSQTVQTRLSISSTLTTDQVVTLLAAAGAQVLAIGVESADDGQLPVPAPRPTSAADVTGSDRH